MFHRRSTTAKPQTPKDVRLRAGILLVLASLLGCSPERTPAPPMSYETTPGSERRVERERMVAEQIAARGRGVRDPRVLEAMRSVPRHEFVRSEDAAEAYDDHPLPIGHGQTISQPYIVAFMTEQLQPQPTDRVLEIGTGSGYQAAVLARLVREVCTIEIIEPLARSAAENLRRTGCTNVHVKAGDGYLGWPEKAPFDAVMVTCAPEHVPQPLVDQLKDGGRLIIPVGEAGDQQLYLLEKRGTNVLRQAVLPVRFVPMTGPRAR